MARSLENDPMLDRIERDIEALKVAIATTYRTPFREVCRIFMCSRSWVDKNVRPKVPHIYVSGRPEYFYHTLEAVIPELGLFHSRTWYNTSQLEKWVDSISTTYIRTKSIPPVALVRDPYDWIKRTDNAVKNALFSLDDNVSDIDKKLEKQKIVYFMWSSEIKSDDILSHLLKTSRAPRSQYEWVEAGFLPSKLGLIRGGLKTVAGMQNWGDSSELIHRQIWEYGMVRTAIKCSDGVRIMYAEDPNYLKVNLKSFGLKRVGFPIAAITELADGQEIDWSSINSIRQALGRDPIPDSF